MARSIDMYWLYTNVLRLGLLLALPYYAGHFRKYLPTLGERLGRIGREPPGRSIWVHAVSVGEMRSIDRLLAGLRRDFSAHRIVVSTTTPTGRGLALDRPDVDRVIYFPLDLPGAVRRSLERIRPELVIVVETEIWPNFLRAARRRGVPVFLVNGRISDQTFPRYLWARRWPGARGWVRDVLDGYHLLGMQSETDADRIRALGAPPEKVSVLGNLKYDLPAPGAPLDPGLAAVLAAWRPLLVAASTAAHEEPLILETYRMLRRERPLKLLVAPRLPLRFNEVDALLAASRMPYARRSRLDAGSADADILLLDSIGELSAALAYADVVFMGGTLVPRGGHNILEAARHLKPVIFGPHMENFRDMARIFLEADAAVEVPDARELGRRIAALLDDPPAAAAMGARARALVDLNAGATGRVLAAVRPVLDAHRESRG